MNFDDFKFFHELKKQPSIEEIWLYGSRARGDFSDRSDIDPDLQHIDYLQDATIQRFEFCIELYLKVLKKFLAYEEVETTTPRDVLKKAYQFNLIDDEKIWLQMMHDRNRTSHVYKQEIAKEVFENIITYGPALEKNYEMLKVKFYDK